ncbi:MAG: hypothetical protein ACR2N6_07780 [Miltoncostaeaceae bacterium]
MTAAPARTGPDERRLSAFGGLVPSAAVVEAEGALIAALAVELHAGGALLPLLVLSDAPGVVGWDVATGLTAADDRGGEYAVGTVAQSAGLGALQAAVWIEPSPPPEARSLDLTVRGLTRTSVGRRGGVEKPLVEGDAAMRLDLLPPRTAVDPPPEPEEPPSAAPSARIPSRSRGAFAGLVPVGQARLDPDGAVCLWAVERYSERSVLTMATITEGRITIDELAPGSGRLDVWDDVGTRYSVVPIHGSSRATWMEASVELTPAIPAEARSLGIRVADLPARAADDEERPLVGPFTYGVALRA